MVDNKRRFRDIDFPVNSLCGLEILFIKAGCRKIKIKEKMWSTAHQFKIIKKTKSKQLHIIKIDFSNNDALIKIYKPSVDKKCDGRETEVKGG